MKPLTNFGMSRQDVLMTVLIGTATVAAIVVPQQAFALSGNEVYQRAVPVTVLIGQALPNGRLVGGSGVIVAKQGEVYTVITNDHVVDEEGNYRVQTSDGQQHSVTRSPTRFRNPDLAIVQFQSSENYSVATLGNSDQIGAADQIYVYGYPGYTDSSGVQQEPQFSPGFVTNPGVNNPESGYAFTYNAVTWHGMSGGGVFNEDGRLIGIHGDARISVRSRTDTALDLCVSADGIAEILALVK